MTRLMTAALLAGLCPMAATAETLQMSAPFPDSDAFVVAARDWSAQVESATNGALAFDIVPNGALVPMAETLEAVAFGVVPAGMVAGSFISGTIPAMGYIELIGSLPVSEPPTGEALAAIWPDLDGLFRAQDTHLLWGAPAFNIGFICREGFLTDPADWQGRKIRTAGRWQSQQIAALGAVPVPLAPSEIYVALQNGVVDCALMIPSITLSARLYEVAPYYTDTGLPGNITIGLIGLEAWDTLDAQTQETIDRLSAETTQRLSVEMPQQAAAQLAELATLGQVHSFTPEEQAAFVAATLPVFDAITTEVGSGPGAEVVTALSAYR